VSAEQDTVPPIPTTGDILRPSAAGQPAQLEAVTPDTRMVTICRFRSSWARA
jgi:hypothetical protein